MDAGASGSAGTAGAAGADASGACPGGLGGGDGTVAYPRWPLPPDQRDASEFSVDAGTVLDHATCLMWQEATNSGTHDWDAAAGVCANLGTGGHTDWRLPTRAELISILDYSTLLPTLPSVFSAPAGGDYWTSTEVASDGTKAWFVKAGGVGQVSFKVKTTASYVRCVRGAGAPPSSRFDTSTAGAVRDVETGLQWEAAPADQTVDQLDADKYCAALVLAGRNDWRLPTERELATLIDPSLVGPALPAAFTTVGTWYWTSTPQAAVSPIAYWAVSFASGFSQPQTYTNTRVRCVR